MEKIQFQKIEKQPSIENTSMAGIEDIKKELKKLEQEIDHKLSTYANFSERIEQWSEEDGGVAFGKDISPSASLDELEILIEKLAEKNKQLNESNTSSSIRIHHRSKLDDYLKEFKRLKVNVNQAWEKAQLVKGRKYESLPDRTINMESLIRERNSIHSTNSVVDDLVSMSMQAKDKIDEQNRLLMGTSGKLRNLSTRFPQLNQIMGRIRAKKYRNTLILGFVISFCICFLLWWWWSS